MEAILQNQHSAIEVLLDTNRALSGYLRELKEENMKLRLTQADKDYARIGFIPFHQLKALGPYELQVLDNGLRRIRTEVLQKGDAGKFHIMGALKALVTVELKLNYDDAFSHEDHLVGYTIFMNVQEIPGARMEGLRRNRRSMVQSVPHPQHDFSHIVATETFVFLCRWRGISDS